MKPLMHNMLKCRVRPYYLFAVDPIRGSAPFRTTVQTGLDIVEGLRGFTTGYATPIFAVDAPGGGGKIQLAPDFIVGRDGDNLLVRNFEDKIFSFPDPGGKLGADKNAKSKLAAE
jgi:lysine 2,3-aminomutase